MSGAKREQSLSAARDLVEPALQRATHDMCPSIRAVAGYHHGWLDRNGNSVPGASGKALRPALALLSARAAGALVTHGVPAAVAVELVHDFSLLHDDVMDASPKRRHRPAAWTVFGVSSSVLTGDAMLTAALSVLLDSNQPGTLAACQALTQAVQHLIAGQASDLEFENRENVTLGECMAMTENKTAALISCACSIGALLVDGPAGLAKELAEFGRDVGLAFQLADDLLGIWGSSQRTGKPVLSDLQARKKSVPVVAALNSGTPAARQLAELYLRPEPLVGEELTLAAKLVEEAGGRAWVETQAANRLSAAMERLDTLALPSDVREEFAHLASSVTGRDF